MPPKDAFSGFHPVVSFLFFALVIGFSMVFMHPLCLGISLVCALSYAVYLEGARTVRFALKFMLPLLLLTALINPAFNHGGTTVLGYLPSGNPLTLESIWYGLAAGGMMIAVLLWFRCYAAVFSTDKFLYLFGRVLPALSVLLHMTVRFVPEFAARLQTIRDAQRAIGRDVSSGTVWKRMRCAMRILSVLITWSLEDAIETADSMRSRGYGLKGRTAFSLYSFEKRDAFALALLSGCGAVMLLGAVTNSVHFQYFPTVKGPLVEPLSVVCFIAYAALCATPILYNVKEDRKWKRLTSAM